MIMFSPEKCWWDIFDEQNFCMTKYKIPQCLHRGWRVPWQLLPAHGNRSFDLMGFSFCFHLLALGQWTGTWFQHRGWQNTERELRALKGCIFSLKYIIWYIWTFLEADWPQEDNFGAVTLPASEHVPYFLTGFAGNMLQVRVKVLGLSI